MRNIFLATEKEVDVARQLENKIMALPISSGISFVGVSVHPSSGPERIVYRAWVGCQRNFDETLMDVLIKHTLRDELESGICLVVEAHRGVSKNPTTKVVDTLA